MDLLGIICRLMTWTALRYATFGAVCIEGLITCFRDLIEQRNDLSRLF